MSNTDFYQNIFYNFNPEQFEEIVEWSKENNYEHHIDIKENNSWSRVKTNKTIEDFMKERESSKFIHDIVIYRRGYENWRDNEWFPHNWCIEIGSRIDIKGCDLFLFIYVKDDKLQEMIDKFNLTVK